MKKLTEYICRDEDHKEAIMAGSAREAAEQYVAGSCYEAGEKTMYITVYVADIAPEGEDQDDQPEETHTIEIHPTEPDCADDHVHDWRSPVWLGGCSVNPGVIGHGGGVEYTEVCRHCGAYRDTDTWAQNPENGEQGLTSIEYRDADDQSTAWVDRGGFEVDDDMDDWDAE